MMSNPVHLLISTLGQTPHTVTEVIGELQRRGIPLVEVHTIATQDSSPVPQPVQAEKPHLSWHNVEIPHPDILTPEGAISAQSTICRTIYHLKRRSDVSALHLDLTGGRKTMSAYLMFAAQLFCDEEDFLWHVSPSLAFAQSQRWYPQTAGEVNLLQIPFIHLDLLVKSIQEYVSPPLDIANPALMLEKSVARLEDLALLGVMARGVDHEANNDLNDLLHRLRRIEQQLPRDSPLMEEIGQIQADAQNLKGMIESFLMVGDPQRVAAEFQPVSLRPLVVETLGALAEIYDLYDVHLEGSDFEVKGDRLLLKRLFRIVLTNAKKHARCDHVRIHFVPDEGIVKMTDDGIGMSAAQAHQAFGLFKLNEGESPAPGELPGARVGKGVGLAVARRIARVHGGDLQLRSQPSNGTTVIFRCPQFGDAREPETNSNHR